MIYWLGYAFWKSLSWIFYPLRVKGAENLPSRGVKPRGGHAPLRGGFILASNHQSYLDPMIIGLCFRRQLRYVAKKSLFRNRVFDFFLRGVGAFPIQRDSADTGAIKETLKRLQEGWPVVIFPEGTTIKEQKKVHPGIGLIAAKSGVPVVPVFIRDSDKVLAPYDRFLKRHPVTVIFGRPKTYTKQTPYPDIARQIIEEINSLARIAG